MCNCIKTNTDREILLSKKKKAVFGVITLPVNGILKRKWGIYVYSEDNNDKSISFDFCPWCGKQIAKERV